MKKTKGITLIALIITIIVMLILVGVTVSILINSNLLGNAQRAADETKTAYNREGQLENEGTVNGENLGGYMQNLINKIDGENGGGETTGDEPEEKIQLPEDWTAVAAEDIPEGWDTTKITAIKDKTSPTPNIVPLPKGYIVSNKDGEHTVDGGLVIKDIHDNEFVWIPVSTDENLVNPYTNGSYSEPLVLTTTSTSTNNNPYDSQETLDYLYGTDYFDYEEDFKYSDEYAEMIASVNKYRGFFVGRYETTIDSNGNIGSVYNTPVLTANNTIKEGTNSNTRVPYYYRWYGMYYAQKHTNYIEGNGEKVQSAMIYGQLWDKIMTFVNGKTDGAGNTFNTSSSSSARHTDSKANSGQNSNDLVASIYDLEGNCFEWTQETGYSTRRIRRRWGLWIQRFSKRSSIHRLYQPSQLRR